MTLSVMIGLLAGVCLAFLLTLWMIRQTFLASLQSVNQSSQLQTQQISYLQNLLSQEQRRVQTLLNQLLSKDPMTLANLQTVTDSAVLASEAYVPTGDEAEAARYEQLAYGEEVPHGFIDVADLNNDIDAAGLFQRDESV